MLSTKVIKSAQRLGLYTLSREHQLLLKASSLKGDVAIESWQKWKRSVDIEDLDNASCALLCQLYFNLAAHGIEDDHIARLKGIYKRNWFSNQRQLKKLKTVLQALEESGLATILSGDGVILLRYSQDSGCRPLHQMQLLMHPKDGQQGLEILSKLGWQQKPHSTPILNERNISLNLQDADKTRLNIIGHLFWAIPQNLTEKKLWAQAQPYQFGEINTLTLGPIDAFLHTCVRTFYLEANQQINLISDALKILNAQQDKFDWLELITRAQRYQVILPLRNMVMLLQDLFKTSIPSWILPALHQTPIAKQELLKYQVLPKNKKIFLKSTLLKMISTSI